MANFIYLRQKGPMGNGTPVLNAEKLIGNEPFLVFWGDEFYTGKVSWVKQMIEVYEKYGDPVLATVRTDKEGQKRYGIIDGIKLDNNAYEIKKIIEKPGSEKAPSNIACVGGYLLTPDIFPILKNLKPGTGGEVWLADALHKLSKKRAMYACLIEGKLYDAGTLLGWLKANVDLALEHPNLKKEFKKYIKKIK